MFPYTLCICACFVLAWLSRTIYNLYYHPLRAFAGPCLWIIFPLWAHIDAIRGIRDQKLLEAHEKYGDVVRATPDILTFTSPDAWADIYGHGHAELPKVFRARPDQVVQHIINADAKSHFRFRRAMLPAFSNKATSEQEPLIKVYVNLLMQRLKEHANADAAVDLVRYLNFTTFDLIADLALGESLGGLEHGNTNKWTETIRRSIKITPIFLMLREYIPVLGTARRLRVSQNKHRQSVKEVVQKRIKNAEYGHRGDFMDQIMRSRGKDYELSDDELAANTDILMVAGSETTATLLAGVIYLLLTNPNKLRKVKQEVRSAFETIDEISFATASTKLPYTLACLTEALRLYPPVPVPLLRETLPDQMTLIAEHLVPANTKVGIPHLAAYRSSRNWHRPLNFVPERWLPESTTDPQSPYFHDRRGIHKPFSFGPRDCIGRNLAYHEMRLIFARLMWEFDIELKPESRGWIDQKIRILWDKPPLFVKIKRRAF